MKKFLSLFQYKEVRFWTSVPGYVFLVTSLVLYLLIKPKALSPHIHSLILWVLAASILWLLCWLIIILISDNASKDDSSGYVSYEHYLIGQRDAEYLKNNPSEHELLLMERRPYLEHKARESERNNEPW